MMYKAAKIETPDQSVTQCTVLRLTRKIIQSRSRFRAFGFEVGKDFFYRARLVLTSGLGFCSPKDYLGHLIAFLGHLSHSGDLLLWVGVRRRASFVNIYSQEPLGQS